MPAKDELARRRYERLVARLESLIRAALKPEILEALEKAAAEKGAPARNKTGNWPRSGKNDDA